MTPQQEPVKGISQREFARRMGVTETAVRLAIKAGKIDKGRIIDNDGKPLILEEIARREWADNFAPERVQNEALASNLRGHTHDSQGEYMDPDTPPLPDGETKTTLAKSQEKEAFYKAELRRVEFEEKMKTLVSREAVDKNLFAFGAELRVALLAVPDRVIDSILCAKGRNDAYNILYNEIADVLDKLSELDERDFTT